MLTKSNPTIEDLIEETKKLKQEIEELKKEPEVLMKHDHSGGDYIRIKAKNLTGDYERADGENMIVKNLAEDKDIILYINDGGTNTEVFRIDGDVSRMGIRIATPQETLHIHEPSVNGVATRYTNQDTGSGATDGFKVGIDASEHALIWHYEGKDIIFGNNNSETMRIKANGKIGFNTDAPATLVDINGVMTLRASPEPSNPATSRGVLWISNGTGYGDDGDLVAKITDSLGVTKSTTIVDFSVI